VTIARQRLCLAALLALALLHGLMQARVRPLYQVSDELQYVYGAQQVAVAQASPLQSQCISPPDGSLLAAGTGGGKWAFRAATAHQLAWACRDGGPFPMFLLRGVSTLSLAVLVASAWILARMLWPTRVNVAIVAGLLVAVHPVLVKYGSGVAPDAWANALAGAAFVGGAQIILGRGRVLGGLILLASTAIALVWKETATFLVAHLAAVVTVGAWQAGRRLTQRWWVLVPIVIPSMVAAAVWLAPSLVTVFGSTYHVGAGVRSTMQDPMAFTTAAIADLQTHLPGMVATSWTVLGNFGGTTVEPIPFATTVAVLTAAGALVGWVLILARPGAGLSSLPATLAVVWVVSGMVCVLQPSARQVWAESQDIHQGRWLFPLAAPIATLVAAGLVRLRPGASWLALPGALWLGVMWITLGHLGSWYYARVPDQVVREHVFLRGTGGQDVGDARVWMAIADLARHQVPVLFWSQAALLCGCTLVTLWLLSTPSQFSGHDRHADHR
jgi:hypothetical protein